MLNPPGSSEKNAQEAIFKQFLIMHTAASLVYTKEFVYP